jgi:hypothetical protein
LINRFGQQRRVDAFLENVACALARRAGINSKTPIPRHARADDTSCAWEVCAAASYVTINVSSRTRRPALLQERDALASAGKTAPPGRSCRQLNARRLFRWRPISREKSAPFTSVRLPSTASLYQHFALGEGVESLAHGNGPARAVADPAAPPGPERVSVSLPGVTLIGAGGIFARTTQKRRRRGTALVQLYRLIYRDRGW